ncbi:MAG: MATE family efflux transporter [Ruminococcaceae bacterium]|nr:MATE family efflux transporter [Oscillospiraceae bacterium]
MIAPPENKMGVMPINKLLLSMALPMVISMVIQAFYNVVDSLYVAGISETQNEFTAISLAFAAQNFMISVATGTGVGINALLSKSLGEKNQTEANKIAANGVFLALCSYVVFLILGLTCMETYMSWMTSDPEVIKFGVEYLSICYIFSFGIFGEIVMERLMISTGRTQLAMVTQAVGAVMNIILDPIFIFSLNLGIKGAAIATVLGQIVAFFVAIWLNARFNKDIHLSFRGFIPNGKIIGRIYAIGVPSIVMASIGSVMNVLFNSILNTFAAPVGKYAQNAFGAYFKLQSFIFMPIFGLNNGIVPIVAYNYGAQKKKRMLGAAKLGTLYAVGYMLIGLVLFQTIPETLVGIFLTNPESVAVALPCVRIISLSFIFAGFCIIIGSVFQALGKSIFSMFVSITRQLVVLIPVAFLLSFAGNVDLVWWAFPIAEVASVIISAVFFVVVYKIIISKIPE